MVDFADAPRPAFILIHSQPCDLDLARVLVDPISTGRAISTGAAVIPKDRDDYIRSVLGRGRGSFACYGVDDQPPETLGGSRIHKIELTTSPWLADREQDDPDEAAWGNAIQAMGQHALTVRLYQSSVAFTDLRVWENFLWFKRYLRIFAEASDASFGFLMRDPNNPEPAMDPRTRTWPLTYYGPELVDQIGRDRLLSAPAWRVESDGGGVWVWLDPCPVEPGEDWESRRNSTDRYLGLADST